MKPSTEFTASGQGHPNYQLYVNPLQTIMAQTAQTAAYGGNPFTGDNNQGKSIYLGLKWALIDTSQRCERTWSGKRARREHRVVRERRGLRG